MAYGILKCDTITFTDAGVDKSVTISGLVQNPTFSGNITVTGTVSGNTIQGQTVSGATITGGAAAFTTVTGGVATITSGVFALGSASNPSISFTGDANSGLYSPGADQVAISTGGSGRLFVDASGKVGVGTTPIYSLHAAETVAVTSDASYSTFLGQGTRADLVLKAISSNNDQQRQIIRSNSDSLIFGTENAAVSVFTEKLRITSAGLVGIGTSSPSSVLHCVGSKDVANFTIGAPLSTVGGGAFSNYSQVTFENTSGSNSNAAIRAYGNIWNSAGSALSLMTSSGGAPVDRLYITSAGNVGIGTTSPAYALDVASSVAQVGNSTDAFIQYKSTAGNWHVGANSSNAYAFYSGTYGSGTEHARIDSSGRLLVGTSTSTAVSDGEEPFVQVKGTDSRGGLSLARFSNDAQSCGLYIGKSRGASIGSNTIVASGDELGRITFSGSDGTDLNTQAASIKAEVDGTPGANDMPGRLVFSTTADGANSPTERMRIDNAGSLIYGTSTSPGADITSGTGFYYQISTGLFYVRSNGSPVAAFNRGGDDGTLVEFKQDQTTEGTISVSGTTVSYNGAHLSRWSQLPSGAERTEILRGSVLSNIDEMCEWGNEDNEQLNRMKVSDVEGDKNVSGVFQAWDDDDDTYTNDFYCAMTGDFIIRIAEEVTVKRGDLLMSAGDGTAKPQDDDIIRSKTIAKVTSTNVSCTYDDGSYCVPCVLMAC